MKLIRLLVAVLALSMVFGTNAVTADAAQPSIAKQAKKLCKKKPGTARKKCVKKTIKRLKEKAKREKQRLAAKPPVTIRTTEYGIPRIVADSYRGLGYGYGYSLAKENICSMADIYTSVRGERSKYFGPAGHWMLTGNGIDYTNLQSDFWHKKTIADHSIEKILKQKPPASPKPEVKEVVAGYVRGYNSYLEKTGVNNIPDATCRGAAWVKPITSLDTYRRFYELGAMASGAVAVDGIADAVPPGGARRGGDAATASTAADFAKLNETFGIGSNAVALGSDATSTGKGMLFGNPHFPWLGSERFFESQLTIPGKMNVSGASLLGAPVILIGHTRNLAWSHTVSTARRFVIYEETLKPGDPTSYQVDGKWKPMKQTKVSVQVKQPDNSITTETRTLYSTSHGAVTTMVQKQPLFGWNYSSAYTMRDPNSDGLRFINHFFDADRSQSVDDMVKTLKRDQGVPWVNTIASDSKGNALYADVSVVPNLPDGPTPACDTVLGQLAWPASKVAVLDGSKSSCDLPKAPGAAAKGILPPSKLPLLIRKDYASNMNDSYWLANPKQPLEGFPSIIGNEGTARSLRTRNGLVQIERRLDGTDGDPGNTFTLDRVQGFLTNNHHYGGEVLIPPLVTYCQANPVINAVNVGAACAALAGWNQTDGLDDPGAVLARRVIGQLLAVPGGPYTTPFNIADPVHTPNGLNTADAAVPKALSDTVTEFSGLGIPVNATWRDYQFVTRNAIQIPVPGGPGSQGMFNVITASRDGATGKYPTVSHGSSFVIAASLAGAKCPDVKTILTYSQAATNTASAHYDDQTKLFSNGGWVTDRFCPGQQKKSPDLKVTKLNGGSKAARNGW